MANRKSNSNKKTKKDANKKGIVISIIVVIIIALAVSIGVIVKANRREKPVYYDFGKSQAQGIDVSEHNKEINWKKAKKSIDFAFIRIGYRGYGTGEIVEDKLAKDNLKGANKAGVPVGVYFYSQAINEKEAKKEAEFAVKKLRKYDIELPVIIDFEYASDNDGNLAGRLFDANNSPEENAKIINAFCQVVEKAGYMSGVYASSSVLHNEIDMKKLNKNAVIWVADYNDNVI